MKTLEVLSGILAVASATSILHERKVSYDGYKVLRVAVGDDASRVKDIVAELSLTTWKGAPKANAPADIVVPPEQIKAFHSRIADINVTTLSTMHEDLGAAMAEESSFESYAVGSANMSWFNSYHAYKDHLQYLTDLQAAYPTNSEIVTSGNSLDGKPITGIHLYGSAGKGSNPAVVFHGTVHAREWISTMVVEYIAYQLLNNYNGTNTDETKSLVDKYDFYIFPVVNPDGFVFTQTTDRLWRKNRQVNPSSSCVGRDINRNWPFQWEKTGGASKEPCAQDYRGVKENDAPETVALMGFIKKLKETQGLKLFLDYHAYAQYFMAPYGYDCQRKPKNSKQMLDLISGAVQVMNAVHGTMFQSGTICNMLYMTTGSSVDYVNDVVKADYSLTLELRDQGMNGFVLPPNQILPSGQEAWAGIRWLVNNLK